MLINTQRFNFTSANILSTGLLNYFSIPQLNVILVLHSANFIACR